MQPDHLRLIYYITLLTKPITLPKAVEYMLNGREKILANNGIQFGKS